MPLLRKTMLLSTIMLAACSAEPVDKQPQDQESVAAASPAVTQQMTNRPTTVSVQVPDGRDVTFDCTKLSPEGALTGAFIAPLDVTTPEQIEEMRRNGTYSIWAQSRADMTSPRSGFNMMTHIAGHRPPYQYCTDQANQIRTGTFQNTGASCPVFDAYKLCRPVQN